jgi:hypothetical protein
VLIAITYANEDGTKEEGRTPKDPTRGLSELPALAGPAPEEVRGR